MDKLLEQNRDSNENKQNLCKLTNENLNLKSRLDELEEKILPKDQPSLMIKRSECQLTPVISNESQCQSTPINMPYR